VEVLQTQVTLEAGKYEGTINIKGSLKKAQLDVSAAGVTFASALDGCSRAPVELESGKILCDRSGLVLRIDAQEAALIRGSVIDIDGREHYKFSVSRSEQRAVVKVKK
jgi:hypothetical protein